MFKKFLLLSLVVSSAAYAAESAQEKSASASANPHYGRWILGCFQTGFAAVMAKQSFNCLKAAYEQAMINVDENNARIFVSEAAKKAAEDIARNKAQLFLALSVPTALAAVVFLYCGSKNLSYQEKKKAGF